MNPVKRIVLKAISKASDHPLPVVVALGLLGLMTLGCAATLQEPTSIEVVEFPEYEDRTVTVTGTLLELKPTSNGA